MFPVEKDPNSRCTPNDQFSALKYEHAIVSQATAADFPQGNFCTQCLCYAYPTYSLCTAMVSRSSASGSTADNDAICWPDNPGSGWGHIGVAEGKTWA